MSLKLQRGSILSNGKEDFLVLKLRQDQEVEMINNKDERILMPWTELKKYEITDQIQIDDLICDMLEEHTSGTFQEL